MIIRPFAAWRPRPEFAASVACVPYDVIDTSEARDLAEGNPYSFLHVIRPEIDLPPETDLYSDEVYARGRSNLKALLDSLLMVQDPEPSVYVYRLTMNGRSQTGVFTCVSVQDYDENRILKHEFTRPDKEDDRTRHILTQQAHAEPVMLAHRADAEISRLLDEATRSNAVYDFVASDGVRHEVWQVTETEEWVRAYDSVGRFYVADGHHRCKAASRVAAELNAGPGDEAFYFPAAIFPSDQMLIMPYNRLVYKCAPGSLERLRELFPPVERGRDTPRLKGDVCVYTSDGWMTIRLNPPAPGADASGKLDVSRLQDQILNPVFGIKDPRSDSNIAFVGGIRGTGELMRKVDDGTAEAGFSMYATPLSALMEVSDAGLLMPPKSTWFEPKLRSGLLIHTF